MIKLLLNAYTEFPSPHQGGPNKVIFDILNGIDRTLFEPYYLSKHLFSFINENQLLEEFVRSQLTFKKKVSVNLIKNSILFKKVVTNPFYLRYHFAKTNKFYKNLKLNNLDYDVLHTHDVKSSALLYPKIKCKKILTIHSKGPIKDDLSDYFGNSKMLADIFNRFDSMEDEAISEADIITFPSYAALELFNSKKSSSERKTKVIYNGIDTSSIQSINTSISFEKVFQKDTKGFIKIINIADHIKPKNIELIISVLFKLIKELKVKVLFINIGSGPLTKTYLSKVKEFELSGSVRFLGKVRNEDAITLLKDSDYLLHPSKRVIFDYVILEALACGTTVIANNVGGNKEILVDGYNGILINDDNYSFISNVIQNEKKISALNMHESLSKFSIEKMIQAYQTLYQE
jgi:L-malate glycosyltransferase